jgi:type I restriction enzyme S subunit
MLTKETRLGSCNAAFDVVPLKEMIDKNDAGSWGSDPVDISMNVVRSTNFNETGYLDLSNVAKRFLVPETFEELKLEENEILIERSGGSETQPVGRVSFITKEVADQGFAYANFIQRISAKPGIDPKYLFYCLYQMHSAGFTQIMQNQTNGIRNLEYRFFLKQRLPKPEFIEQQKIAAILSSIDNSIKATRTSIEKLDRLKKSLMQNLLTGKMKPDGSWRNEDDFYQDEKLGQYPKEWAIGRVKEFFVLQRGHDLTDLEAKAGKYPVVKSNGISINHYEFKAKAPGVVTGRSGTIGNVFYIDKDFWPHNTTLYVKDFCMVTIRLMNLSYSLFLVQII